MNRPRERAKVIPTASGWQFTARSRGPAGGRCVLLLHGFPETSRCWVDQLDTLGDAGHRAVAFDQRGYSPGARPSDLGAYEPDALVADVLEVADSMDVDRLDLVGHDFGGMVAWMVAGHHPDRVRTLSVASTPHPAAFRSSYHRGGDQHERSGYMRSFRQAERGSIEAALMADDASRLRAMYAGLPLDAVEEYVSTFSEPGALVAAFDWYRSMSGDASAATPPSPVPTLYVWGDQDPSIGRAPAEATGELVTGPYQFETLVGVGHWIPELGAREFTPLLLAHLASHPRDASR